jgi:hypothetical protein
VSTSPKPSSDKGARRVITALAAVLTVEAALVLVATVTTIVQFATHGAQVEADGIAFIACLVIGFLWVGAAAAGAWLTRRWARGLAITWQLIQLVVGVGALEGLLAGPLAGIVLIVLAIAGGVLVITPAATRALRRDPS